MSPLFFVSGLTGDGLTEAVSASNRFLNAGKKLRRRNLKEIFKEAHVKKPAQTFARPKKAQSLWPQANDTNPPIFELLVNHPAAISQQFRKFVENSLTKFLDFYGTPIVLKLKGKDKK